MADKYDQPRYLVRGRIARAAALAALGQAAAAKKLARSAAERADELGWPGLAWRAWSIAEDFVRARRAVVKCAEGLDEPLRGEFLAAVPVEP
jgi:hypothetical protein